MTDSRFHRTIVIIDDPVLRCLPEDIAGLLVEQGYSPICVDVPTFLAQGDEVRGAEVVVAGVSVRFERSLMAGMPHLKAVVVAVVGTDSVDIEAASSLGIFVANSPATETAHGMAEATLLLILACMYDLTQRQTELKANQLSPRRPTARMLHGRTIGLIGFGRTARALADRLRGWGVTLLAYDRGRIQSVGDVFCVSLERLLSESDVVSLHLTLSPDTQNFMNSERLKAMRRGAVLVNTARGGLVDEDALADLCAQGHIQAVGLDVFVDEPLALESPLRSLSSAVLTPHSLGHTQDSFKELARMATENVVHSLSGLVPPFAVNADFIRSKSVEHST